MKRCIIFMMVSVLFLSGCGSTGHYVITEKGVKLRDYRNVFMGEFRGVGGQSSSGVQMSSAAGQITASDSSAVGSAMGSAISSRQVLSGDRQALIALDNLEFELTKIGFNVVSDPQHADAIVEFSIGAIRYEGYIKITDVRTGNALGYFSAKPIFITPTVDNIIKNLSNQIRKSY